MTDRTEAESIDLAARTLAEAKAQGAKGDFAEALRGARSALDLYFPLLASHPELRAPWLDTAQNALRWAQKTDAIFEILDALASRTERCFRSQGASDHLAESATALAELIRQEFPGEDGLHGVTLFEQYAAVMFGELHGDEATLAHLDAALAKTAPNPELHRARARALAQLKRHGEAVDALARSLEFYRLGCDARDPDSLSEAMEILELRAQYLAGPLARIDEALADRRQAAAFGRIGLEVEPEDAFQPSVEAHLTWATTAVQAGHLDETREAYRATVVSIESDPFEEDELNQEILLLDVRSRFAAALLPLGAPPEEALELLEINVERARVLEKSKDELGDYDLAGRIRRVHQERDELRKKLGLPLKKAGLLGKLFGKS